MKIAIDTSPIEGKSSLQHRVRGTGFYTKNLIESLQKYDSKNAYTFFNRGETLPAARLPAGQGRQELPKDIGIVHYPYFEPFFLTLPVFNENPFVVTVHDLTPFVFPQNFPIGIKGKLKWQIQKLALKKAKRIVTDSISSKNDIIKYAGIPENKIDVVYLAAGDKFRKLKIENLKLKIARKYDLPEKFALYVGDVTWNKNLPRLVEASIKADVPLVMTGKTLLSTDFDKDNPWNQDLVKVQKLSEGNKNIIRIGFVSDQDLVVLYNIAAVFVMPSIYEGFGLPVLEAMSCGCPVVTSREGSLTEVAGDAAFYVDAYDVDSISDGIRKVFSDTRLRKELSEKGIVQAQKFSWKKTARNTIDTYKYILER
ncbi:MAG: glycosyltransferase family 1 protein [Patescibacteria group bacterium]